MRLRLATALALLGAALIVGIGVLQKLHERASARAAFPRDSGRIAVTGIAGPVEIFRDRRGVPHVEARGEADAFFGLGFAHAQDRLAQMLWLARRARGTTAEVVGEAGLADDRLARTLGFAALAEAEVESLDAAARRALEAYAAGVNARIARIHRREVAAPLALRRLGATAGTWQPSDSLAVFKLYSWGLSDTVEVSLVLSAMIERLGGFGARRFFPGRRDLDAPPVPWRPPATVRRGPSAPAPPVPAARHFAALRGIRRATGLDGRSVGSSAWVVGGAHTRSGLPVLAADSHYEPTAPAALYVAHFRGGALDVAGATIPGVPVVWTGHNGGVAWASTHARAVTADLYVETLRTPEPSKEGDTSPDEARAADRYHNGRGWRDLVERVEEIPVRGRAPERLVVRSTHHGPLVSDILGIEREHLALAWIGARPAPKSGVATLLAVARASDARDFLGILARHEEPVLAFAYADSAGAAGVQVAGYVPQRALFTGLVPVPGRARWYDWQGRVPFSDLPRQTLGNSSDGAKRGESAPVRSRGFAVASDDEFAAESDDSRIEWLWRNGARSRRIEELLRAAIAEGPLDVQTLARLQADVGGARGHELATLALDLAAGGDAMAPEARDVVALLREWDGRASAQSRGAAAYHVFLECLTAELLGEPLGEELLERYLALSQADPAQLVLDIVRESSRGVSGAWGEPEDVRAAVRRSLRESWFRLSFRLGSNRGKWTWGSLHQLRFRPFGPAAGGTGPGPFAYGGDDSTVVAAEYDPADPFDVRVASTFRFAADGGALDQSLTALAPGQSEHPGHPHFGDGVAPWIEGRAQLLATSRLLVEQTSVSHLVLEPEASP